MRLCIKASVGSASLPSPSPSLDTTVVVHHGTRIADIKNMVREKHALSSDTKLDLYTDHELLFACQDDARMGGYHNLRDGSTLYLAPYDMAFIKLPVQHNAHTTFVLPPDAVGHRTPDGHVVVGYDFDKQELLLKEADPMPVTTALWLGSLRPPNHPIRHGPLERYGQCNFGEVKIVSKEPSHVVVVNSNGQRLALLPTLVQPLCERVTLQDVSVIVNEEHGFFFKQMLVTGGVMNLADVVLHYLHMERGMKSKGRVRVYRVGGEKQTEQMTTLRRVNGIVLQIKATFCEIVAPAKRQKTRARVISTTWASVLAHSHLCDVLDMSPWLLPRTGDLLLQYMDPCTTANVQFDSELLRKPYYVNKDGIICIATKVPELKCAPQVFEPNEFVSLYRNGVIRACQDGRYVKRDLPGCWADAKCTVDLSRKHEELEQFYLDTCIDMLVPLGSYKVASHVLDCPTAFIDEMFGSAYDKKTDMLTYA